MKHNAKKYVDIVSVVIVSDANYANKFKNCK